MHQWVGDFSDPLAHNIFSITDLGDFRNFPPPCADLKTRECLQAQLLNDAGHAGVAVDGP